MSSATGGTKQEKRDESAIAHTTQDLAYAQIGLAFYYYLTRDESVLQDIVRIKNYIFDHYYDASWDMLRWVTQDSADQSAAQQELVAQLDQINAYMLLLQPILPPEVKPMWTRDMMHLIDIIIRDFYNSEEQRFYGYIHDKEGLERTARHADFGHTIKAFWMIYLVAQTVQNEQLADFVTSNIAPTFERAFLPPDDQYPTSSWSAEWDEDGITPAPVRRWWIYAELDQAAATLALKKPAYLDYLPETYAFWLQNMTDQIDHGVYGQLTPEGPFGSKVFHWKNGYHETEHALVAYITTSLLHKETFALHYAFTSMPTQESIHPYYYQCDIQSVTPEHFELDAIVGRTKQTITFKPRTEK